MNELTDSEKRVKLLAFFIRGKVEDLVNFYIQENKLTIPDTDKNNHIDSIVSFAVHSASKYCAGQRKHGGSILDRDLKKELTQELVDSWQYHFHDLRKSGQA